MMANTQGFRAAFNGFNREDVVRFIESMHERYKLTEGNLREEISRLEKERDSAISSSADTAALEALKDALARQEEEAAEKCAAYEKKIEELQAEITSLRNAKLEKSRDLEQEELEIYRRAERTERLAKERVNTMFREANMLLSDAQSRMNEQNKNISAAAAEITVKLKELQVLLGGGAEVIENTASNLMSLHIEQE